MCTLYYLRRLQREGQTLLPTSHSLLCAHTQTWASYELEKPYNYDVSKGKTHTYFICYLQLLRNDNTTLNLMHMGNNTECYSCCTILYNLCSD